MSFCLLFNLSLREKVFYLKNQLIFYAFKTHNNQTKPF